MKAVNFRLTDADHQAVTAYGLANNLGLPDAVVALVRLGLAGAETPVKKIHAAAVAGKTFTRHELRCLVGATKLKEDIPV